VVLIDVKVAVALELEVECAVAGEELKHVVEEANAGGDFVLTAAFDDELNVDAGFGGVALDNGRAGLRC
jgi:hypothetical protein